MTSISLPSCRSASVLDPFQVNENSMLPCLLASNPRAKQHQYVEDIAGTYGIQFSRHCALHLFRLSTIRSSTELRCK